MSRPGICIRITNTGSHRYLHPDSSIRERLRFGDYVNADGESEQHNLDVSNDMPGAVLCLRNTDADSSRELHAHHSSFEWLRFGDFVNADGEAEQHRIVVSNDMPGTVL